MRYSATLLLAVGLFTTSVSGQRNAASFYVKAWTTADRLPASDWHLIRQAATSPDPTVEAKAAVRRAGKVFQLLQQASARAYSDFNLDYDNIATMQTNHLPEMVRLSMLLEAQVRVEISDGNGRAASAALACVYGMANHLAQDGVEMSLVIARQVIQDADRAHQYLVDRSALGRDDAYALLTGLEHFDADGPLSTVDTIVFGATNMVDWYDRLIESKDLDSLNQYLQAFYPDLSVNSVERARESLELAKERTDEIIEMVMAGDIDGVQAMMVDQDDPIDSHDDPLAYAMIICMFQSAPSHMMMEQRTAGMLRSRRAELQQLLEGKRDAAAQRNAALLYREAAGVWRALDAEVREAILASETVQDAETWSKVKPILSIVEEAASLQRSDFSALSEDMPGAIDDLTFVNTAYLPDMKRLLTLVRMNIGYAEQIAEEAGAIDSLVTHLRVIVHVAEAQTFGSSVVAADEFDLLIAASGKALLPEAGGERTREVLALFSKGDPFGFSRACRRHRAGFERLLRQEIILLPNDERSQCEESIGAWTADDVLHWLLVYDVASRSSEVVEVAAPANANVPIDQLESTSRRFERERLNRSSRVGESVSPDLSLSEVMSRLADATPWDGYFGQRMSDVRSAFTRFLRSTATPAHHLPSAMR